MFGQSDPPPGRFRSVAAAHSHSCGIRETGELVCWGDINPAAVVPKTLRADWLTVGRIIARRLDSGAIEFGFRLPGGERILPDQRFFPAEASTDRRLNSSPVLVDGQEIGRISARRLPSGRVEFGFLTVDGEHILPVWRTLSPRAAVGEWLWGSEIGIEPPLDQAARD